MLQHEQGKRVLLVSANDRLVGPALRILGSAGHTVSVTKDPPDARAWLRTHQANLVAVDLADDDGKARSDATSLLADVRSGRQRGAAAEVLALTRWRNQAQTRELFQNGMLTNYLGVDEDGSLDPLDLGATVGSTSISPRAHPSARSR
jgi:CheY-like chemotaxis protein